MLRLKEKIIRRSLGLMGLATVAFIFEACYGVPQNDFTTLPRYATDFSGFVQNEDMNAIGGQKVMLITPSGDTLSTITNEEGKYFFKEIEAQEGEFALSVENGTTELVKDTDLVQDELIEVNLQKFD